jgi:hypothetical protein
MKTNTSYHSPPRRRTWAGAAGILLASLTLSFAAEEMFHPTALGTGGGVVAQATITSTVITPTNATLCWYGMQGFYTVEMSTNLATWTAVGSTAATAHEWCLTVPNSTGDTNGVYFRLNQANSYVGSGGCAGCHGDKHFEWVHTGHAGAINALIGTNGAISAYFMANCVKCHSVGKDQPTGFLDITNTPHLSNVGCESCHGPSGWHKYSDKDLIRPATSQSPMICGSCHQDAHHPTYEEYHASPHSEVNGDIKYGTATPGVYYPETINVLGTNWYGYYVTTNATNSSILITNRTTGILHSMNGLIPGVNYLYDPGQDRAVGCGLCHSAAARMAMLKDYEARLAGRTNAVAMPAAHDAAEWTATCVTCHDPHSKEHVAQLRTPLWSTNFFTMPTTSDKRTIITTNFQGGRTTNVVFYSAAFANMYNPDVQVCGQCHNSRGGRWDGRSYGYYNTTTLQTVTAPGPGIVWGVLTNISYARTPHHSPQYNIFSGIVQPDYLNGTSNVFGAHSLNTNGCAACHMPTKSSASPTEQDPNYTGHEFEPLVPGIAAFTGCNVSGCHDGTAAFIDTTNGIATLQIEITNAITALVTALNEWAYLKGTNTVGATAYNAARSNSWEFTAKGDLATFTNAGPNAAAQLNIPVAIRQARFNLYMVAYGKSLGIHNPTYTRYLLNDASNKVWQASQP